MRADFGDVTGEYQALRTGTGFVTGMSAIVWVRGTDAVEYLDGQLSQDVAAMAPGDVARSFLLEPRGKLAALLWVLRDHDGAGLVVDAGWAAATVQRLERFRFRVDATVALDDREIAEVWGPDADASAAAAGVSFDPGWAVMDSMVIAALRADPLQRVLIAGVDSAVLEGQGLVRCGSVAADTVRIEAGEPVMGRDVDESTIPQESGLVDASVSFTKGCYVGQELVARIDSRGRVNQRLTGVTMTTNVVPPVGSELVVDGAVVGRVTTVGESLALRAPVALAMVRREVDAGSGIEVRWEGGAAPATIRELPMTRLGSS
jgi:folate-binding protein YgfZ